VSGRAAAAAPPVRLRLGGGSYDCRPDESVLQALRRQGVEVPHACEKGVCFTCLLRCTGGSPGGKAQAGLRDSLRLQGFFLACQCLPESDLEIAPAAADDLFVAAEVASLRDFSREVRQLRLRPLARFEYRPGQFINLRGPGGLVRSYSLASLPESDPALELHVRRHDNGAVSGWIFDRLQPGQRVEIQGPSGACFYVPGDPTQPLLLVGTGTGLSPLLGIAREALSRGHRGPIRLYHGSRTRWGLYLDGPLRALAASHPNFDYVPCASRDAAAGLRRRRADDAAFADLPSLSGWRVFLCGNPPMVAAARKRAYLAGARLQDIYGDPFELRDLRRRPRA